MGRESRLAGKIAKVSFGCLMIGTVISGLASVNTAEAADKHEVPLSPYHPQSNEGWWMYQFAGYENAPEYWWDNANCGPACSGMVINYLRGKNLDAKYNQGISHQAQGTSTSLTATALTDTNAYWTPNRLVNLELNPNVNQTKTFTIVGNSEHTISIDGENGNISSVATIDDSYAIYYHVYSEVRWYYSQAYLHSRNIPNKQREDYYEGYYNDYKFRFSSYGAYEEQIRYALSSEGIRSHTLTGYDCKNDGTGIRNLQNAIDQGKVCICLVDPSYYHETKCHSHWTVVYGYDDDYIYLNDPGYLTPHRSGDKHKVDKSDFANALWEVKELSTIIVVDTIIKSSKFNPGDYVRTTANLNIRTGPEIRDDNIILLVSPIPQESMGRIIDDERNGVFADGYYWWYVHFDGYDDGWCAENWLEKLEDAKPQDIRLIRRLGIGEVRSVDWSPDKRLIAIGTSSGLHILDSQTLETLKFMGEYKFGFESVAFSPDGFLIASGSRDYTTKLWRVSDGECIATLNHGDSVASVAFSPDGSLLASGGWDRTIKLWKVSDRECVAILEGHLYSVRSVAFSPDGNLIASGSLDNTIKLWRVSDGKCTATLEGHTDNVYSIAFNPDGTLLASGGGDETIRLWRVSDGKCTAILKGHEDRVYSVAFSPDGSLLASGSRDNAIKIWRVSDGKSIATLNHEGYVNSVAFSSDSSQLVSGSMDNTIGLWGIGAPKEDKERPNIRLSASSHGFGTVPFGSHADWHLIMSNLGDTALTVNSIASDNPAFTIASLNFPQNILPGDSLDVTVRFSPSKEKSYTGTLTIASNDPGEPEVSVPMQGIGKLPENQSPVSDFTYAPEIPEAGDRITFDASPSYDPNGMIVSYKWDFGDGSVEAGKTVTHPYSSVGNYKVTLTVADNSGTTATVSKQIIVDSAPGFPITRDYVRSFIQRETREKVIVNVEGQEYAIVTLEKYLDPGTLTEHSIAEKVKVYVDSGGNPVSVQEIARKIGIVDYIRRRQRDGLEKEVNDDFAALTTELRNIGQMPLVEWVIETSKTAATAPLKVKEAVAGKVLTEIANIASKELVSLPGKMTKEQLADKADEFIQKGMNRYDQARRILIQSKDIVDYDTAFSVLENYLWGEANNEMASFLAYRLYYEKYVSAWDFFISELKKTVIWGLSELTSATMISLDAYTKWEHEKADVQYQLYGKAYEATEYTLSLAAVPYTPVSEYKEKIARVEKVISDIVKFLIDFLDRVSFFKYFLGAIFHSPGEVRVYDSQGRTTGLVNGAIKEEIPNSLYDHEQKTVVILSLSDSYRYDIVGTDEGEYGLEVVLGKDGELTTFTSTAIPTAPGATHEYTIDWQALSRRENGVTVQMDADGDGIFEQTIITDNNLTQDEYLSAAGITPNGKYPTTWADLKRTKLLQNYPNPFNPDTWIPYILAEQNRVVIKIHATTGELVRTLDLGNKPAGLYLSKYKAAYWDGHDGNGESVASGTYFYTFYAGSYQATMKMGVMK